MCKYMHIKRKKCLDERTKYPWKHNIFSWFLELVMFTEHLHKFL